MRTRTWVSALVSALLVAAPAVTGAAAIESAPPLGNPTCEDLGFGHELKVDPPQSGTYTVPGLGDVVVDLDDAGVYFDWSSTFGIDAVIAKGGNGANVYDYSPEAFAGTGLVSPVNPSGSPAELSHASFCYDYELAVAKTAETDFTRTYAWTVDKVGSHSEVLLTEGQQLLVDYDVTVDATYVDSGWTVEGDITIVNPDPVWTATIEEITDVVSPGLTAPVVCDGDDVLLPGETLTCSYGPLGLPDGAPRLNTATVTTTGYVEGGSATADVLFGNPSSVVDECVDVDDDLYGPLGTVCADDAPYTFEYSMLVSGECGFSQVTNTASFLTDDTAATGSDSWTVDVTVNCDSGCSLTPGYWKTHSEYGPAPYDDTWALLAQGADSPFFLSAKSYYEVLNTPPAGNAYYILAPAYIAAELNGLNGADTTEVDDEMAAAKALLETVPPAKVAKVKPAVRAVWISLAETLDAYNNGLVGPGHCTE